MDQGNYMSYARAFGYGIRFTGIGMAYVTIEDRPMTEAMDTDKAEKELALIGLAIMQDALRNM